MVKLTLNLNSVEKVKEFINIISKESDDYDLTAGGRYIVDAKSIMGIFSLNLSSPLTLLSKGGNQVDMENKLYKFMCNPIVTIPTITINPDDEYRKINKTFVGKHSM